MTTYSSSCHCGALRAEFETDKPFAPRACQCSFCRRHDARSVSDPDGRVVLTLEPETRRYRFGTMSSDFLICGRCGVYVGALAEIAGGTYAVLNLNAFDDPRRDLEATPFSYDGETAEQRAARRHQRWTPARIIEA